MGRATLEVLVRPRAGLPGPVEREIEQLVSSTLDHVVLASLHPRTAISITVQIVQDDGALLSAVLNAVSVALLHAAVPLRGVLAGCTVALQPDGELLLDPTADEEQKAEAVVTAGYLFRQRYQYDGAVAAAAEATGARGGAADGSAADGCDDGMCGDSASPSAEAPLPGMVVERQLLLSHVRGVIRQEQYEMCLHAVQQASACAGAFCRHAVRRTTASDTQ